MASDLPAITFVEWRGAKTDPPNRGARALTWTPRGPRAPLFAYLSTLDDKYKTWDAPNVTLDPQPSVWCDPRPPVESEHGPLTMDDLLALVDAVDPSGAPGGVPLPDLEAITVAAIRLRHAIEEADRA
jgi:hypothetical protein